MHFAAVMFANALMSSLAWMAAAKMFKMKCACDKFFNNHASQMQSKILGTMLTWAVTTGFFVCLHIQNETLVITVNVAGLPMFFLAHSKWVCWWFENFSQNARRHRNTWREQLEKLFFAELWVGFAELFTWWRGKTMIFTDWWNKMNSHVDKVCLMKHQTMMEVVFVCLKWTFKIAWSHNTATQSVSHVAMNEMMHLMDFRHLLDIQDVHTEITTMNVPHWNHAHLCCCVTRLGLAHCEGACLSLGWKVCSRNCDSAEVERQWLDQHFPSNRKKVKVWNQWLWAFEAPFCSPHSHGTWICGRPPISST